MFSAQTETYLSQVRIPLRLACLGPEGWPRVLSLWFLYRDGLIYCATQASARVVGFLRAEPRCGFEIAADQPPYCGVRGRGSARLDPQIGEDVLRELLVRYQGGTDTPLARTLLAGASREVAIIITPTHATTWNYSQRMAGSPGASPDKLCP